MSEYILWPQFTAEQCVALHESKLMRNFTDEQIVRLQFTQKKTIFLKGVALRALSNVLGREITGDEAGLNNSKLLKEYMELPGGRTLPTIEADLLALIPEAKWHIVGMAKKSEHNSHLKKA